MKNSTHLLPAVAADYRRSWKTLAATDVVYRLIAFIVLTPLAGGLFRLFVKFSGRTVLADVDILKFFVSPWGWLCLIAMGVVGVSIVALQMAALLAIVRGAARGQPLGVVGALRFAGARAVPVLRLAWGIVAIALLWAAPFLAAAGAAYVALLTKHDINFYLKEKPPEFWVAIAVGGVLAAGLGFVLLRLFTNWFFALPLVLFEAAPPSQALRLSTQRGYGHRRRIAAWILGWLLVSLVVSSLASAAVVGLGHLVVPAAAGSLRWLAVVVGLVLSLWVVVNVAVHLLSATVLAAIVFRLYQHCGRGESTDDGELPRTVNNDSARRFPIGFKRLTVGLVVAAIVSAAIGALFLHSVRLEDHTQIAAHRGASAAAPENSLAAVQRAIDDGADWVEIDVQETADGEVVVLHDSDFKKLAGVDLKIWDATLADVRQIDIGSSFSPEFKDERVPTLAEVLAACRDKIGVIIELKYYGHDEKLEERVAQIVEAESMQDQIIVMSLSREGVRKMQALRPEWTVGLLTAVALGDVQSEDADFFAVNIDLATRRFIRSGQRGGKQVFVWTVNDPVMMSTIIGRGADVLLTDEPALARRVLEQRANMSTIERLLIEAASYLRAVPEDTFGGEQ